MRSSRKVAGCVSGILVMAYLSGCASVPRSVSPQTTQIASAPTGPPIPAHLNKKKNGSNVVVAGLVPALRKTGDVLLDIVEAVLPEPVTNSYNGKGFRGWRSWERSIGWTGCTGDVPGSSGVQWCSNP